MKRFSYNLPASPVSRKPDGGVVNIGFQYDTVTSAHDKTETPCPSTEESGQVQKEKDIKNNSDKNDDVENDDDTYCGLGSWRPNCMESCRNMACFSALYSVIGLVMAALSSYINSQITTLEKNFNLSSSTSGFLMACDDLGFLSVTLFVSYYTRRVHIPRALSYSSIFYGFSGVFCAVAFFATRDQIPSPPMDIYNGGNATKQSSAHGGATQMCHNVSIPANHSCITDSKHTGLFELTENWRVAAISIIAIGMILQGVSKSTRQPFLAIYVDDNVPKTKTSVYLGITTGMAIFGPGIAFALGGVFSSIYITLEETSISPRDPRWLGAWWLGFLVFGGAALIVALPILCFPNRMNKQKKPRPIEIESRPRNTGVYGVWRDAKDLLKFVMHLFVNPVFMFLTIAGSIGILTISGFTAFFAKYMETQFTIPASKANLLIGGVTFTAAPVGTIVGGFLTSRFKMSPKTCLKFTIVCRIIDIAACGLGFVFGCDQPTLHTGIETNSSSYQTTPHCLQDCHCDENNYFPICGSDGNSYFSPCHAGCVSMNNQIFTNCSCLATNLTQTATGGLCEQDCTMLPLYLLVSAVGAFSYTLSIMPAFIATIRSVKETEKPLAIGLNAFITSLCGWFPGPMIYGALVDSTCLLWKTTCSSVGACSLYDIDVFRFRFTALSIGLRAITVALFIIALIYSLCSKKFIFQPHRDDISVIVTVDEKEKGDAINNNEVSLKTPN